jgi:hypothetical protein
MYNGDVPYLMHALYIPLLIFIQLGGERGVSGTK